MKKVKFSEVNFNKVDFFHTRLKGIDFSDCSIQLISVSDQYFELKGMKIDLFQAVEIAKILGIEIL